MVNYGNGKIYKVICSETGRVYVGSTSVTLSRRMTVHRDKYNTCMTKDFIDGKIFLIEDYPCERKEQLLSRERFFIESMECVNKIIPTRTKKEYYQDNKEHVKEYQKDYYQDNKEKLSKIHKEYHEVNKEKLKIHQKDWREKNKEKLSEKINCECGGKYTHSHKSTHFKTKKHIKFSHNPQTSQPSDACLLPIASVP